MLRTTSPQAALPPEEQPRERLLRHGPGVLTDAELLAVLLRTGTPGCNALELGRALLTRFGGLRGLFAAPRHELRKIPGLGDVKTGQLQAILELARREIGETLQRDDVMDHPEAVRRYCATTLAHREVECCLALYLDTRNRLIAGEMLSEGTLAQATLYPRELVRAALRHHAAAVILAHNHPSGNPDPSQADEQLTRHVRSALLLVDVRLLDHLIVAGRQITSMAERGLV
ncbi:DNA repair protein RadC [Pigmentiphaga soli]|uniref:DNA repair protein RadC n=1 Tax=Pigmentiphaga soli TaxID=1007095 RepID=A0ABP8HHF5_9BURK